MNYIIVDFEWNQPTSEQTTIQNPIRFDAEIIEIGAVKINEDLVVVDEFQSFVKPLYYPVMNGKVSRITKIRSQDLAKATFFRDVYHEFLKWCGDEYCLCIWGQNDIPTLFDNLIMHGIEIPDSIIWCDLQRVFGTEIMRDDRQWALETVANLLKLPKDRAHDALNDARNTYRVCTRVDLIPYCSYYENSYVNYSSDRKKGLITGRLYSSADEVLLDDDMFTLICPYCGETIMLDEWIKKTKHTNLSYGRCHEGNEFLARFQKKRRGDNVIIVSRMVYEMNDILWDDYQEAIERENSMLVETG